jgi:alpha-tubulin suppressor-like RCC1 family protein
MMIPNLNKFASLLSVVLALGGPYSHSAVASTVTLSFGLNRGGQLGLGNNVGNALVATPIVTTNLAGKRITQVAAGSDHSLVLADDGTVYSFGLNSGGSTGLGTSGGSATIATPIDTTNLVGKVIAKIAAGTSHSLLLSDDGVVFSFGWNSYGQTGLGIDGAATLVATPINTTHLADRTMTQIAAGFFHNLLLADDGTVFSFGSNVGGQTGLGTASGSTLIATPIDTTNLAGKTITQVAAGRYHSLLLADDGTVFSFGANQFGITGLGTESGNTLIATPIDTTNLAGKTITQVAAGRYHSLLLADDGTVFAFGINAVGNVAGLTGLGAASGSTLVARPINMSNLAGRTITQVSAGQIHSLLLADDGTVFSFGSNSSGATGLGTDSGNTRVATLIDNSNLSGLRVIAFSAGGGHSLLLAVPEPNSLGIALLGLLGFPQRRR